MKSITLDWRKALIVLNLAGLVFVAFIGFKMVQLLTEKPWLIYPTQPFHLPKLEYRAGDEVTFQVERINADDREHVYATSHRLVCDGRADMHMVGGPPVAISPGRTISVSAINAIPKDAAPTAPGKFCHIAGVAEINGHMLSWTVPWRTEDFKLVP